MDNLLETKGIVKSFKIGEDKDKVLDSIDFNVKKEEFVCLLGPSGSGKSTFLRIISNLETSDHGEILRQENLKFSFVFQNFALFPWLTVAGNIGFGLKMTGVDKKTIAKTVQEKINQVNLGGFEKQHPKELSGGMKQRVGLARALATTPDILLLDEPFSLLDVFTARKLRDDLLNIWQKGNLTIVMVSHLVEEAVLLADKIVVFSSKPAKVLKALEINLERPRKPRTEEFYNYVDQINKLIGVEKSTS